MSNIAAIFDLDKTLLLESSEKMIVRYLRQTGQISRYIRPGPFIKAMAPLLLYRLRLMRADRAMCRMAKLATGVCVEEFWGVISAWFRNMAIPAISKVGAQKVAWHRAQGHIPVICSGGSQFSVRPMAAHLRIEHTVYTNWLEEDGRLTGHLRLPIAYGEGKVYWMKQWAAKHNVDLAGSYFYSDSISDRPLLEAVGFPVAVNPDRRLLRLAKQQYWDVQQWI